MVIDILSENELKNIIDEHAKDIIEYFIKKAVKYQPELKTNQSKESGNNRNNKKCRLPLQVPKEHIEQWFVQALDVDLVSGGNNGVDVVKVGDYGIDVKMIKCKCLKNGEVSNTMSGEMSLKQSFKDNGKALDTMFEDEDKKRIIKEWRQLLEDKYNNIKSENNIKKIYYFFVINAEAKGSFYLCGAKINTDGLKNITSGKMSETKTNLEVRNFIDENYGKVKIYKSKKRMELRLYVKNWIDTKKVIEIPYIDEIETVNMREELKKGNRKVLEL